MDMDLIKVKRHFVMQVQNADNEKCVYQTVQTQNIVNNECYVSDGSSQNYFDNGIVKNEPEDIEIDHDNCSIKCEGTEIKLECESLTSPLDSPHSEDSVKYSYFVKLEQDHISLTPDINSVQDTGPSSESIEEDLKTRPKSQVSQEFFCTKCNYKTLSKKFFKAHLQKHTDMRISDFGHAIGTFHCASCSYKTMRHQLLVQHYQKHHPITFNCANCNYETENNGDFKEHVTEHEKITKFSCEKCSYMTYNKCEFDKHILAHEVAMLTCVECNYKTENRSDFERHLTMHVIDAQTFFCHVGTFKCPECDYETENRSFIKDHLIGHEVPSHKKVRTKNRDSRTMISDECNDNPLTIYKCKVCQFKTGSMGLLEKHSLCHDDEKQAEDFLHIREVYYKCESCGLETKNKTTLKQHQARHFSGQIRYFCKHCEYKTFYEKFYRQHLLSHGMKTQSKPVIIECVVCHYKAKDKNDLKIHSLKHRDVSQLLEHKCAFCDGKGSICRMQHGKSK